MTVPRRTPRSLARGLIGASAAVLCSVAALVAAALPVTIGEPVATAEHCFEQEGGHFRFLWEVDSASEPLAFQRRPGDPRLVAGGVSAWGRDECVEVPPAFVAELAVEFEAIRSRLSSPPFGFRVPAETTVRLLASSTTPKGDLTSLSGSGEISLFTKGKPGPGDDGHVPADDLRATAAHEFFHCIQEAYVGGLGVRLEGRENWFGDGTATWIERRLYPNNKAALAPALENLQSLGTSVGLVDMKYGAATMFLSLAKRNDDIGIVRGTMERAGRMTSWLDAFQKSLVAHRTSIVDEWHALAGALHSFDPSLWPGKEELEDGKTTGLPPRSPVKSPQAPGDIQLPPLAARGLLIIAPPVRDSGRRDAERHRAMARLLSAGRNVKVLFYTRSAPGSPGRYLGSLDAANQQISFGFEGPAMLAVASNGDPSRAASVQFEVDFTTAGIRAVTLAHAPAPGFDARFRGDRAYYIDGSIGQDAVPGGSDLLATADFSVPGGAQATLRWELEHLGRCADGSRARPPAIPASSRAFDAGPQQDYLRIQTTGLCAGTFLLRASTHVVGADGRPDEQTRVDAETPFTVADSGLALFLDLPERIEPGESVPLRVVISDWAEPGWTAELTAQGLEIEGAGSTGVGWRGSGAGRFETARLPTLAVGRQPDSGQALVRLTVTDGRGRVATAFKEIDISRVRPLLAAPSLQLVSAAGGNLAAGVTVGDIVTARLGVTVPGNAPSPVRYSIEVSRELPEGGVEMIDRVENDVTQSGIEQLEISTARLVADSTYRVVAVSGYADEFGAGTGNHRAQRHFALLPGLGGTLTVRVVDVDGAPVGSASLQLRPDADLGAPALLPRAANGTLVFAELEPGRYVGTVEAQGYEAQAATAQVRSGTDELLTVVLHKLAYTLTLVVLEDDRTPITEAQLVLSNTATSQRFGPRWDVIGTMRFVDLPRGTYAGTVRAPGFEDQDVSWVVDKDRMLAREVYLKAVVATWTLDLTVLDDAGRALSGVELTLRHQSERTTHRPDALGSRLVFRDLPEGNYRGIVRAEGFEDKEVRFAVAEPGPDPARIALTPLTYGLTIEVSDQDRKPLAGANLTLSNNETGNTYVPQRSASRLRYSALPAGVYAGTVSAAGYVARSVRLTIDRPRSGHVSLQKVPGEEDDQGGGGLLDSILGRVGEEVGEEVGEATDRVIDQGLDDLKDRFEEGSPLDEVIEWLNDNDLPGDPSVLDPGDPFPTDVIPGDDDDGDDTGAGGTDPPGDPSDDRPTPDDTENFRNAMVLCLAGERSSAMMFFAVEGEISGGVDRAATQTDSQVTGSIDLNGRFSLVTGSGTRLQGRIDKSTRDVIGEGFRGKACWLSNPADPSAMGRCNQYLATWAQQQ